MFAPAGRRGFHRRERRRRQLKRSVAALMNAAILRIAAAASRTPEHAALGFASSWAPAGRDDAVHIVIAVAAEETAGRVPEIAFQIGLRNIDLAIRIGINAAV